MQHWLVCSTLIINMLNESCLHYGMGMSHMTCFRANISSLASSILSVALNMSYRPYILCLPWTLFPFVMDTTSQPVNRPVYVKHNILSCKYNCMLELLGLSLVLHILQTFFISLKAFINADPSKMMKLASGSVSGVTCFSRIVASCDFWQLWRLPLSLSAAGKDWCSCWKIPSGHIL
jgi:hypothetical protein